jgi:hypothetical protein
MTELFIFFRFSDKNSVQAYINMPIMRAAWFTYLLNYVSRYYAVFLSFLIMHVN